jgi:SAM-dependent methyltransferase
VRLYTDLADWWHVMSAPADYAEEAAIYRAALEDVGDGRPETLLELGSGGGNNASHLKRHYRLTLVEPADGMRARSEELNPECRHLPGDMRTVRLDETFDAVFIHDAIMYMTTEEDLRAALRTAFVHCRPGGLALFVPDDTRETWRGGVSSGGHDRGERSLRYLQWVYDPDPADTCFTVAFAFLLKEGAGPVRIESDEHVQGLFPRATWLKLIRDAGFEPLARPYGHSSFNPEQNRELFLGVRPSAV